MSVVRGGRTLGTLKILAERKHFGVAVDSAAVDFGGGLTYARHALPELAERLDDARPLLICTKRNVNEQREVWSHDVWTIPQWLPARLLVQQLLPLIFPRAVVFGTGNLCSAVFGAARSVVLVQDIRFFGPTPMKPVNRFERLVRFMMHRSVRRARRVIAVSQSLADAIVVTVPEAADKVSVALSAPPAAVAPERPGDWSFDPPFLVSIANGSDHKRLDHTVQVWKTAAVPGLGLAMAGYIPEPRQSELVQAAQGAAGELHMLGPVADTRALGWLMACGEAVLSMSEQESYGLTLVEAGQHGSRLLVTSLPAHIEVAGTNATYVDVGDVAGAAAKVAELLASDRPAPWSLDQTWGETADAMAAVLDEVAS